jgi:hypothetical protein
VSQVRKGSKPLRVGAIPFLLLSKPNITGNLADSLFFLATYCTPVSWLIFNMKIEVMRSSRTSVHIWHYIPENGNIHNYCCGNLKSGTKYI